MNLAASARGEKYSVPYTHASTPIGNQRKFEINTMETIPPKISVAAMMKCVGNIFFGLIADATAVVAIRDSKNRSFVNASRFLRQLRHAKTNIREGFKENQKLGQYCFMKPEELSAGQTLMLLNAAITN